MTFQFKDRQKKLFSVLKERQKDAFLSTSSVDMFYLIGFQGEGMIFCIAHDKPYLITDARYTESALKLKDIKLVQTNPGDSYAKTLCLLLKQQLSVACGKDFSFKDAIYIKEHSNSSLYDASDLMVEIRREKDKNELKLLKEAAKLSCEIFRIVQENLKVGIRESEVAAFIVYKSYEIADGVSFEPIVAFGANSSMPHYKAGHAELREGDIVLIDMGARFGGYCGDITRTFVYSGHNELFEERYGLLERTRSKAITSIVPGSDLTIPEKLLRELLGDEARFFVHSLGHGLGLEIHERPFLSSMSLSSQRSYFSAGDVFTVEPGLYYPGWGGIRIEDDFIIDDEGLKKITF